MVAVEAEMSKLALGKCYKNGVCKAPWELRQESDSAFRGTSCQTSKASWGGGMELCLKGKIGI